MCVRVCDVCVCVVCVFVCVCEWCVCVSILTVYCTHRVSSRFMLVTDNEFMLVEPDKSRLGCGVITFIAFLQVQLAIVQYQLYEGTRGL